MDFETLKALAQLGGVGLFAGVVWWELRQQRMERSADAIITREIIAELRDAVTGLLERERMRHVEDSTPPLGNPIKTAIQTGYRKPATPMRGTDVVQFPKRKREDENE